MNIKGINHLTFVVSNLDQSIKFYQDVFHAQLLVKGNRTAYLEFSGLWVALIVEENIPCREINDSYTHIAFSIDEDSFNGIYNDLNKLGVLIIKGRPRDRRDKKSIYFTDPDGHKFEFHTGT